MIWYVCDCCGKTLAKHEPRFEVSIERLGSESVPMIGKGHYCESCFLKIREAVEVVKHDA